MGYSDTDAGCSGDYPAGEFVHVHPRSSRCQLLKTVAAQKSSRGLPGLVPLDSVTEDFYFYVKLANFKMLTH